MILNSEKEASTVEYERRKAGRIFNCISIPLSLIIFIVVMFAAFDRYFFYVLDHMWIGIIVLTVAIACIIYILWRAHRAVVRGRSILEMVFTSCSCAFIASITPIIFIHLCYAVFIMTVFLFMDGEEIMIPFFCIYTL